MTRVNIVNPSELSRKHLVAEYREIVRVFSVVRKAQLKGKNKWNYGIPAEYTLGTGHVKFFANKLEFVLNRYHSLVKEMINRGYNPNPIAYKDLINGLDRGWFGSYTPTDEALEINRKRIAERS